MKLVDEIEVLYNDSGTRFGQGLQLGLVKA